MTLIDDLVGQIRSDGPIPFSAFMEAALYDPRHGYYASGAVRTGWAGDFITSPQIDPAFGALWAAAITELWDGLGRPDEFTLIEVGPGEGEFATALLDALPVGVGDIVTYRLVERVPAVQARQRTLLGEDPRVVWDESIGAGTRVDAGVVLANEVLDNLPVDVLEMRDGSFHEICVGERAGALVEVRGPEVAPPEGVELGALAEGHRIEVRPGTSAFVRDASARIARGAVAFIDYGYARDEIPQRPGGTLVCYSGAGADDRPLDAPGAKDITAHVDWSALAVELQREGLEVTGPHPQSVLLRALGAGELDRTLKEDHARAVSESRGADAVALLSRRHALRALLDRGGLGRLDVMFGLKGLDPPAFLKGL